MKDIALYNKNYYKKNREKLLKKRREKYQKKKEEVEKYLNEKYCIEMKQKQEIINNNYYEIAKLENDIKKLKKLYKEEKKNLLKKL